MGPQSIREIRRARGLTLEETVKGMRRAGRQFTMASLSRVERQKQPYNQSTIAALAIVLHCRPADLVAAPKRKRAA